jgi:extracellular factor (EF) 3-hydroxypalmitic acid methyl ester biosynthesis protein
MPKMVEFHKRNEQVHLKRGVRSLENPVIRAYSTPRSVGDRSKVQGKGSSYPFFWGLRVAQVNSVQLGLDRAVTFKNSQGSEARGTLISVSRTVVVVEVYNPYSVVQLSEVLTEVRILRGDRCVYSGKAVVSSIVPTGVMLIVSATLVDPWQDLSGVSSKEEIQEEIHSFIRDFDHNHTLHPDYQLIVGKMGGFLAELSRWLDQVDIARDSYGEQANLDFTRDVSETLNDRLVNMMGQFEVDAAKVPPEAAMVHMNFARRQLHPYTLVSPFIHRTFSKPLGYAGDYEMVNMILDEPYKGRNTYAKVINGAILNSKGAQAHRNRVDYLTRTLSQELRRTGAAGRQGPMKVLNIGCGPAGEVQKFVSFDDLAEQVEFHLLDFNEQTLAYTKNTIKRVCDRHRRSPVVETYHRSVNDLLRDAARGALGKADQAKPILLYDMVYCAGLFDYFNDKICQRLMQLFASWTVPGGLVISTNVHPANDVRHFLEHILEWNLIYRNEADMLKVAPGVGESTVVADHTGVNVFLEVRMPPPAPIV